MQICYGLLFILPCPWEYATAHFDSHVNKISEFASAILPSSIQSKRKLLLHANGNSI